MRFVFSALFLLLAGSVHSQAVLSNSSRLTGPLTTAGPTGEMTHALVLTTGNCDSALSSAGISVNGRFGNILSLHFPVSATDALRKIPCISYIEFSNAANAARLRNDLERTFSSVDRVNNGSSNSLPRDYKGKGVIIGIVDIGFQCDHPTFFTADGKQTRISRYWQQSNTSGPPPAGFSYGTEISDTFLIRQANDMDGTHGTHVAGIAGGSGHSVPGNRFAGMAPEAELVFVSIKYANDTLGGSALGDYLVANPAILDAYSYIFSYAQSVGKPAVINLSWGMHTGPHDGSSLFDQATASLTGKGRILVGANGNEGDNPMHLDHVFSGDTVATLMTENGRQFRQKESVYTDIWGSANSSFSVRVRFIDTLRNIIAETPFISSESDTVLHFSFKADSSVFGVSLVCEDSHPLNGKPNITVMASHPNQRKYAIVLFMTSLQSSVHAWNSGAVREWTSGAFRNKLNRLDFSGSYLSGNSRYTAGENGGTSASVISVGALAARSSYTNVKGVFVNDSWYVVPGQLARFSSRGPTVDGRFKPDVSAPGYDVPSAVNNRQFASWMLDKTLVKSVFRNDTQYWSAFNGTSMAAPHVTGIVALLLEVHPGLDPAKVLEILRSTATADAATGAVPNNDYGWGKVNAYAAVIKTLQESGINLMNTGNAPQVFPNPFGTVINVVLPVLSDDAGLEILNLHGQTVYRHSPEITDKELLIDTAGFPPGIYVLRFCNRGEVFILKLLKN